MKPSIEAFNLPLLRVWCRKNDAWLSFQTREHDRYFINSDGYYVELPDRRLAPITARVAFPLINCYPSVTVNELEIQSGFGSAAYFVFAKKTSSGIVSPECIKLSRLRQELEEILPSDESLTVAERYLSVRVLEVGLISEFQLAFVLRQKLAGTLGQELVRRNLCQWEDLLGACLDTGSPSSFDPPVGSNRKTFLREWELAGEILIAMGTITRSRLEFGLKVKREGSRFIGEILEGTGACAAEDVEKCLELQEHMWDEHGGEARLGNILLWQGKITAEQLERSLTLQHYGRKALGEILMTVGQCPEPAVRFAIELQRKWREMVEYKEDRLGEALVQRGLLSVENLRHAMALQERSTFPLGRILVESDLCTPEEIVSTLLMRDYKRQCDLHTFIRRSLMDEGDPSDSEEDTIQLANPWWNQQSAS